MQTLLDGRAGEDGLVAALRGGHKYLFLLYGAIVAGSIAISDMARTESPASAWAFRVLPFASSGEIFFAAALAIIRRIALPLFALAAAGTLAIWGSARLSDIAFAAGTLPLVIGVLHGLGVRDLPFSLPLSQPPNSSVVAVAGGMLTIGVFALAHWLLISFSPALVLPVSLLPLGLGALLLARIARTPWSAVAS